METRAHHMIIGAFTIVAVVTAFLIVLWLGKLEIDREYVYYDIVFKDAVTGLNEGADVRYQGISVGNVTRIRIDPDTPGSVRVTVRLRARSDIKIRMTARASLELAGLTGLSYVLITAKDADGEELPRVYDPDEELPKIASEQSQLQSLFANLPGLLSSADELLRQMQKVVSDENAKNISAIIADIETLTDTLSARQAEIDKAVSNVANISEEVAVALDEAGKLAAQLSKLIEENAPDALESISGAAGSINVLSKDVSRLIRTNEDSVNTFMQQGLGQVGVLVQEVRELVENLNRVTRELENDPSSILFGGREPQEVKADLDN